ncbi:MAG: OmpA family protein [Rhizobiaceae bacterium]
MTLRPLLLATTMVFAISAAAQAAEVKIKSGSAGFEIQFAKARPARIGEIRTPTVNEIMKKLDVAPQLRMKPQERVTIQEFKRRPDLRRRAPSIEIQSINFAFGSAEIPYSQYGKVENIAVALERVLGRNPGARVLIEGHTDAVGSDYSNYLLSERRAASLKRLLVTGFGIPSRALETVGYGEEYLLVPVNWENLENRRVTLRRYDAFAD